jgi:hypothetical protein
LVNNTAHHQPAVFTVPARLLTSLPVTGMSSRSTSRVP